MSSPAALLLIAIAALTLVPSSAEAQIYAARDANGVLVLSDKPLGPHAATYPLHRSNGIRTTSRDGAAQERPWDSIVERHARAYGVRADLVRAVIHVESGNNPRARSSKGAMGLMQLMPATAEELGVLNPYDPAENIRGGVAYLSSLLGKYAQNEELALAAYNAGPAAVDRFGVSVPPFRETQDYVKKVAGRSQLTTRSSTSIYEVRETRADGSVAVRYTNQKPAADGHYRLVTRVRPIAPSSTR